MMERMKARITLSLDETTVAYLTRAAQTATGGNLSAYVDRLAQQAALAESVAAHADWYAAHPGYAEAAEDERYAA